MITERMDPKTLVNNIVVDTKSAAQDTVALAKAEIQPAAKAAGTAGGMFGAAGYLGANAASLLFMAGGFGFGLLFQHLFGWGPLAATALGLHTDVASTAYSWVNVAPRRRRRGADSSMFGATRLARRRAWWSNISVSSR